MTNLFSDVGWIDYKETQNIVDEHQHGSVYADAVNHCKAYQQYIVGNSIPSSVHEITHRINADLRNGAIELNIEAMIDMTEDVFKPMTRRLWKPVSSSSGFNCFYCLNNRSIKLDEPPIKKRDIIPFIPSELIYSRYKTYVIGQTEWDNQPLYIFDEWSAYQNDLDCSIDMIKRNIYKEWNNDNIFGPVEFISYATAVLMATNKATLATKDLGEINYSLKSFTVWMIKRALDNYNWAKDRIAWKQANECVDKLMNNKVILSFWKNELGYDPNKIDFFV